MRIESTKICVIGLGYVGLPLALEFSKKFPVVGFDINEGRINDLNNLQLPIFEPGLKELVTQSFKKNKLKFTTSYKHGCKNKIIFI